MSNEKVENEKKKKMTLVSWNKQMKGETRMSSEKIRLYPKAHSNLTRVWVVESS